MTRSRCTRCAEITQNLPHAHAFSREILRAFERRSRAISVPNAAQARLRAALTRCVMHNARGARQPNFCVGGAPKSHKICHAFAHFLAKLCALSNAKVAQSRCQSVDVVRVAQRMRRTRWERVTHSKSYSDVFFSRPPPPLKKLHGKVTSASFLP